MTCYYPKQALRLDSKTKAGKDVIRFLSRKSVYVIPEDRALVLPCGQCVGCRLERSRQWAVRCEKEIQVAEQAGKPSCFITLTFNDESLRNRENPMSLNKRDFQLFIKRLRRRLTDPDDKLFISRDFRVRYYHCGEYGEQFKRPHYHAIIFGFDFPDKVLWKVVNEQRLFTSAILSDLWPFGFCSIGSATFDSAAYVARYIMKKHFGKSAWLQYADIDYETGEIRGQRIPEYTTMSRRSGIGKEWLDKYLQDVYPSDKIFVRGKFQMCKPPRYYDSQYEIRYPSDFLRLKQARIDKAKANVADNTPMRLDARQKVLLSRIKVLKRDLE